MEIAGILLLSCSLFYLILFSYPFVMIALAAFNKGSKLQQPTFTQPVSILIACYNEEKSILNKINSFLEADEWIEDSEILVISAGSTDGTNELLKGFQSHPNVRALILDEHLSKIEALNFAFSLSRHDILVFSDCRQRMEKGSLKQLIKNFSDDSIGTVNSTLVNRSIGKEPSRIRIWLNKTALAESVSGSSLNVYGALYAQRKTIYRKVPADLLFDDLFVVVSTIAQGKRLVQEKNAIIYDIDFGKYYQQERIERLTRGLLIFLVKQWQLILKMPAQPLFRFLIFKYLKLLMPFIHILFIISVAIMIKPFINPLMVIAGLATLAIVLWITPSRKFLFLFCRINFYIMTSTLSFLFFNKRDLGWKKLQADHI
jgi:biofilm PGA synthesis N-glycosyltransferase PgaC